MKNFTKPFLATCIALFFIATNANAQNIDNLGTEFWIMFNKNFDSNIYPYYAPNLTLTISGNSATTGMVEIPGLGFSTPFSVTPGSSTVVFIPSSAEVTVNDGIENLGIHVTAQDEVAIYGLNQVMFTTDAYMGIPVDALGNRYRVLSYPNDFYVNDFGTTLSVVGTQNGTTVTITPKVDVASYTAGVPFTISLNAGEVYQLINDVYLLGSASDLSGTLIESNFPISVFGASVCVNIPAFTAFCDHITEQLPSTDTWGTQFLAASLETRTGGDIYRFVADLDNTDIFQNGVIVGSIDEGDVLELDLPSDSFYEFTSSNPVLLAQYSKGSYADYVNSDPFMMLIPPYEQYNGDVVFSTPSVIFNDNFVNIVTPDYGVGAIAIDGVPIPAASYTSIIPGYSGIRVPVDVGEHSITGNGPFGAFIYGFAQDDSYGYPGSQLFSSVALIENIELTPEYTTENINNEHCVTATVTDEYGNPLEGIRVDFFITGVNVISDFDFTDANGEVTFCYDGTVVGLDNILAVVGSSEDDASVQWIDNAIPGCIDDTACNFNPDANTDDGSCLVEDCLGECGGTAMPGDACDDGNTATTNDMLDADCNCVGEISGCTEPDACNFNPDATADDGSCLVEDCLGECGGSAMPGDACDDGDATTLNDMLDADCNCVGNAIPGCTDNTACNFDSDATADDGSCLVDDCLGECGGSATPGDACDDGDATTINDMLDADCNCIGNAVPGCTDDTACNFNPDATADDGSCLVEDCLGECGGTAMSGDACDDGEATTINDMLDEDCNCIGNTVPGCTDDTACNFNPDATADDGSCLVEDCLGECGGSAMPGDECDDGDSDTDNDMLDADCNCMGTLPIVGCTNPDALNYNPDATIDDGCCFTSCNSLAGTLMFTNGGNYGNGSYVCFGDNVVVDADDFLLMPCQSVYYVYHTVNNNITTADLPLSMADVVTLGSFLTNDEGKATFYVTAFGATNDGAGGPDYSDPCLTIGNTLTVEFLDPIEIATDEDCDTSTGEFTYEFTITGGLPECLASAMYTVNGAFYNGSAAYAETITVGPITDGESYDITVSDANGCTGDFTKNIQCEKLPIELITYKGEAINEGNLLKWETATEFNNDYFTLESSANGYDFKSISTIAGNGTTSLPKQYSYLDTEFESDLTYYRLSQTDFDGTSQIVGVVLISRNREAELEIMSIEPVPAESYINITYNNAFDVVEVSLYNNAGQLVVSELVNSGLALNRIQLNVANLSTGMYLLKIQSGNKIITEKVLKN